MNNFCQACGNEVATQYRICPACGGRKLLPNPPPAQAGAPTSPASASAAAPVPAHAPAPAYRVPLPVMPATVKVGPAGALYAGFWVRLGAYLLDVLIMFGIALCVNVSIGISAPELDYGKAEGLFNLVAFFVFWLYHAIQESGPHQATFGKRVLGLRVGDEQGQRLSFPRATGRFLGKIMSSLVFGAGFLMIAFSDRKQGMHDKIASTLVLRYR